MDGETKAAYRYLLYRALLEIRPIQWGLAGPTRRLNPVLWIRLADRARRSGTVADAMHNLALFSALDFERFDEEQFWSELDWFQARYPKYEIGHYRTIFEMRLAELKQNRVN